MNKKLLYSILFMLVFTACAQQDMAELDYIFYDRMLEEYLLTGFCVDVDDGEACDIEESPLTENLKGVCCGGKCVLGVSNCYQIPPEDQEPAVNIIKKLLCFNRKENEVCVLTDKKTGKNLEGKCCDGMCYFTLNSCDELITGREPLNMSSPREPTPEAMEVSVDELKEKIKILSCLGIPDNSKCEIPENLAREYNLWGVCCDEKCCFRVDVCTDKPTDDKDDNGAAFLILLLFGLIVFLVFIVFLLLIYRFIRKKKTPKPEITPSSDYQLELIRLNDEKKSIEEMIKLAQFKFHKRKLDEESFREIVRDQQKKLIEIEANIKDIERRITKIEEKQI